VENLTSRSFASAPDVPKPLCATRDLAFSRCSSSCSIELYSNYRTQTHGNCHEVPANASTQRLPTMKYLQTAQLLLALLAPVRAAFTWQNVK
jgi:hypothetical protein